MPKSTRIDLYNGTYVAFVIDGETETRRDFSTREDAQAWVDAQVPTGEVAEKEPSKRRGRPKQNEHVV